MTRDEWLSKLVSAPSEVVMPTDRGDLTIMVQEWMVHQAVEDCIKRHMAEIEESVRELLREDER